jgi:hypothetical protein
MPPIATDWKMGLNRRIRFFVHLNQPVPDSSLVPRCSFLGAGPVGRSIYENLTRLNSEKPNGIDPFLFHPLSIDIYHSLIGSHIIFIADDINDHAFKMARELAVFANPVMLISCDFRISFSDSSLNDIFPFEAQFCLKINLQKSSLTSLKAYI